MVLKQPKNLTPLAIDYGEFGIFYVKPKVPMTEAHKKSVITKQVNKLMEKAGDWQPPEIPEYRET